MTQLSVCAKLEGGGEGGENISQQETRSGGSRLDVLKHGVELANIHLDLMYTKLAAFFNKELNATASFNSSALTLQAAEASAVYGAKE